MEAQAQRRKICVSRDAVEKHTRVLLDSRGGFAYPGVSNELHLGTGGRMFENIVFDAVSFLYVSLIMFRSERSCEGKVEECKEESNERKKKAGHDEW